jgi:hypothetical protein
MADTTTIMSRCHEHDGEWMPEPGSKEYQTRWDGIAKPVFTDEALVLFGQAAHILNSTKTIGALVKMVKQKRPYKCQNPKTHWKGSTLCRYVLKSGDSQRMVDGSLFDAIASDERCKTCDWAFMNS